MLAGIIKGAVIMAVLLALLLSAGRNAKAQSSVDGAIAGTVLDQTDGPVAGALLKAVSDLNENPRVAVSGPRGEFLLARLVPGTYRVTASGNSFAEVVLDVTVELGSVAVADVRLRLAPVLTTLDVDAVPIVLPTAPGQTVQLDIQPEGIATDSVRTAGQAESLPVDGRRWQSFALQLPGVSPGSSSDGAGAVSFRGLATTQNSSQIDGASEDQSFGSVPAGSGGGAGRESEVEDDSGTNTGAGGEGARAMYGRHAGAAYTFAQGAVQEFRVRTGNYTALDGHAAGGVVTTISKSGTSQLRGSLFYLARNSAWGATNPFSIVSRYTDGVVSNSLVKPRDFRQQFGATLGGPLSLHKPGSKAEEKLFYFLTFDEQRRGFPAVSSPGYAGFYSLTATQRALLGNRGVTSVKTNAALNYLDSLTGTVARRADQNIVFAKLDWQASPKNHISLQENHVRWDSPAGVRAEPVVQRGLASIGNSTGRIDAGIVRWVDLWTSHLSNEVRVAYSRDFEFETAQRPLAQEPGIGPSGLAPEVSIGPNGFIFGTPASLGRKAYPDERRFQVAETLEWAHRRHLVQLGAEFSQVHDRIDALANQEGTFHYDSSSINGRAGGLVDWITDYTFNANAYPNGACPSINAKDHFFCFRTFTQSFGQETVSFTTRDWAGFLQDSWRAGSNLQISLGVRYEYQGEPPAQHPNAALDAIFGARGASNVLPRDKNNVGPRAGVVWSPFGRGKGVLRLGYGLYFGRLPGATIRGALIDTALPSSTTHVRITPSTITGCPQVANQGFGYGCVYLAAPPAAIATTTSATVFDRRFRLPAVQQASLGLERQIGDGVAVGASYLINFDTQLPNSTDINIAPSTGTRTFQLQGGPVHGSGPRGVANGETFVIPFYTGRVSSQYGPVTDIVSNANATYHALVVEAQKRNRSGLEFRVAWTWSKAIDYGQNSGAVPRTNGQFDPFTLGYDKGLSTLNTPHKVTASAIWEPSVVTPRRWLRIAANGWQVAPLFVATSGRPYSYEIFGGTRLSGGHTSINGSGGAVYLPTVGRNTLRLPETIHMDLRASRGVRITERLRLRASAEVFNLPNHVNFTSTTTRAYLPGATAGGITPLVFQDAAAVADEGLNVQPFGAFTASGTSIARERQVQLGVRLEF